MITLREANYYEIMGYQKTKLQQLVDEFIQMETEIAEIDSSEHKNVSSCVSSFASYLRRNGLNHIKAKAVNGKAYLINELVVKRNEQQG